MSSTLHSLSLGGVVGGRHGLLPLLGGRPGRLKLRGGAASTRDDVVSKLSDSSEAHSRRVFAEALTRVPVLVLTLNE